MKNLSVSKIEKWLLCPQQFKYQYIDHIPSPTSGIMMAGNVFHEIAEKSIKQFPKTGKHFDLATMDDMFLPTWEEWVKKKEEEKWFIGWDWPADDPEEKVKAEYRALLPVLSKDVFPTLRPYVLGGEAVVEHRVEYDIPSKIGPFKLLGYADLLEESGILQDWKTTKAVSARAKSLWLQFAAYSVLFYPIVGEEEMRCEKLFMVRGENPHVERVPMTVGRKHRQYFVDIAQKVWLSIHHELFLKVTDTWVCKPDRCSFWAGCQGEVSKRVDDGPEASAS